MSSWFRILMLSLLVGTSLAVVGPSSAKADEYWDGYWGWYDNTYRPYTYRQYNYYPRDYYYGGPYSGYGRSYYSYPPARYYGGPNVGVYDYAPRGGSVQVGPMRFGWR